MPEGGNIENARKRRYRKCQKRRYRKCQKKEE
jgi:hypothetical protein